MSDADRSTQRGFGTRELVLGWCLWLIGTWTVLLVTVGWAGHTPRLAWNPSYRLMTLAAMIGLMGIWPAVRLSQSIDAPHRPRFGEIWRDWFALNLVFQAVLWPVNLLAQWSWEQALWVSGALAGWSLLTGLLIAWGRCFASPAMRVWAMVACIGVVLAEPVLYAVTAPLRQGFLGVPVMRLSPLQVLWNLSGPPSRFTVLPWAYHVLAVGLASVLGWVVLAVLHPGRRGGEVQKGSAASSSGTISTR